MPRLKSITSLDRLLADLVKQRQVHADALTKIDGLFAKYGIKASNGAAMAHIAGVVEEGEGRVRRKRRKFSQTADELILEMLGSGRSPTTAEINSAWSNAGRTGKADNTLSLLVKNKKIKRLPLKEGRGSKYALA